MSPDSRMVPGHWATRTNVRSGESQNSVRMARRRAYLPVRVSDASSFATEPLPEALPRDEEWETIVRVALRPRPDLSPEQQQAVCEEYGFAGQDATVIETRTALAFYLDRRWGLNLPGSRLERIGNDRA